jgi:hypothetical protein
MAVATAATAWWHTVAIVDDDLQSDCRPTSQSGTWCIETANTLKWGNKRSSAQSASTAPLPFCLLVNCWVLTWQCDKEDNRPPALWSLIRSHIGLIIALPLTALYATHTHTPHYMLIVTKLPPLHPSPSIMITLIKRWWIFVASVINQQSVDSKQCWFQWWVCWYACCLLLLLGFSFLGGNTPWATDLERNISSASLYSAHGNSIVTPQNR